MQYRNDDDLFFGYIVKDAKVPDAQTVSRRLSSAQPLDTAPTRTVGLVPQVGLHRIEDRDRIYTPQTPNLPNRERTNHNAEHDIILLCGALSVKRRRRPWRHGD
jgi:hypothetical protein